MTVPSERASEASALASRWIAESPHLIDVLDWHKTLCARCAEGLRCPEYREILDEYGAGPYGSSVFFPDGG